MTDDVADTTDRPLMQVNVLLTDASNLQTMYRCEVDKLVKRLNELGPYYKIECTVKKRMPRDMHLITDEEVIGIFMDKDSAMKMQLLLASKFRRHANTDERQVHIRVLRMEPFTHMSEFQPVYLPTFEYMCQRYLHHLNPAADGAGGLVTPSIFNDMQSK